MLWHLDSLSPPKGEDCCKITHWFGRGESVLIGFANKSVTWFSGMFVLGHKEVYLEYNREELGEN